MRFFQQSLHPHLSLGDHAELAIVPLSLIYALWQDARMLLLMQAAALAACAWPLWRIAKFRLAAVAGVVPSGVAPAALAFLPLLAALAFLLNPSLHHIGLFEFHVLAFALFPLLMAMLSYEIGNRRAFVLWCVAALLVREDVAMVVFMFGVLAWAEGRCRWWRIVPSMFAAGWFVAMMALIAQFAPGDSYKFRVYYDWMGATPLEMLTFPFRHPLQFGGHFLRLGNLDMLLGLLMPFAFLPLLRPRRLLLLLGPLAQILLGAPGGGEVVLRTHYATLFLPALALAAVDGLAVAPGFLKQRLSRLRADSAVLTLALLSTCAVYSFAVMSPLPNVAARAIGDDAAHEKAEAYRRLLSKIPDDASVAASYALLPALSTRETLVSLHYVALGVTQFAERPYDVPETRFVALDGQDLLLYDAQFAAARWAQPYREGVLERIKRQTGMPVYGDDGLALYDREGLDLTWASTPFVPTFGDGMTVQASWLDRGDSLRRLHIATGLGWWTPPSGAAAHYVITDAEGHTLLDVRAPIDAPLPWTSRNGGTTLQYVATLPEDAVPVRVEVRIETIEGANVLNDLDSPHLVVQSSEVLKSATADIAAQ